MASDGLALFEFFNEIGIINQLVSARAERALPDGLTMSQFSVLNHFARLGGTRTPLELATAFQVTKGAMTNTLQKLEAKKLIKIAANPDDARSKVVSITKAGLRKREQALAALGPAFADVAETLPLGKMDKALPLLRQVRVIMDEARN